MMILTLRNALRRTLGTRLTSTKTSSKESGLDPQQEALLKENCILVDESDKIVGQASKRECHLIQPDGHIPLHRAFSVFLFNKKGDLLLHKRSSKKITYPDFYTNSCCGHPLADIPGEDDEANAIGIKKAAQRRMSIELGIPTEKISIDNFKYLTRVYYKDDGNGKWGEHEIDYILFLQDDLKINPNPNEISELIFVPKGELDEYLPTLSGQLTPWFSLILKHRLKLWWDNLDDLAQFENHQKILRFDKH